MQVAPLSSKHLLTYMKLFRCTSVCRFKAYNMQSDNNVFNSPS